MQTAKSHKTALEYQRPDPQRSKLAGALVSRESWYTLKIWGLLAFGIPGSFIAPLLLTLLLWKYHRTIGWGMLFLICSAVAIPILYWLEHRTRGQLWESMASEMNDLMPRSYSWDLRGSVAGNIAILEILLFFPRLTLDAVERWKAASSLRSIDYNRAADMLQTMLAHDGRVSLHDLKNPIENAPAFRDVASYLDLHEWIDVSRDGKSAWVLTDARRRLVES